MKKKLISLLLVIVMALGMVPVGAVENEETPSDFNPLNYITDTSLFEAIKGDNTDQDNITTDLKCVVDSGRRFYADVDENTHSITWNENVNYWNTDINEMDDSNIKVEWVESSAPTYISVNQDSNALQLLQRPLADQSEPAKEVVLTAKVSELSQTGGSTKEVSLNLTIQPGEYIKSAFDYVKEGLFESIQGTNTSIDNITADLPFPKDKNPAYADVNPDGTLSWKEYTFQPHDVKVEFISSNHPEILEISESTSQTGILFKGAPVETTEVTIHTKLTAKEDTSVTEDFDLVLTVPKSENQPSVNILDVFTADLLFKAIQGTNTGKDNITTNFAFAEGTNNGNPFFAQLNEDGSFKQWWGGFMLASAKIEIIESSKPELIEVDKDELNVQKFPETDTVVNLTFKVTDWKNQENSKEVIVPVTLKAANILDVFTEDLLFKAIQGTNTAKNNITTNFAFAEGTNNGNPFYAQLNENGTFKEWLNDTESASAKIEILKSSKPELVEVDTDELNVQKFPETDTVVNLTFKVTDCNDEKNSKEVIVPVTLKAESTSADETISKELQGYLNKYLTTEYIQYTTIECEGVDFGTDYKNQNVRYDFRMPRISSLAGLPYGTVKSVITSSNPEALKVKYMYVAEPIRADVGGEAKTVTLTYTLTKEGKSACKDFTVVIPALTQEEINEELSIVEKIQKNFFEGICLNNYDKDNVTNSLQIFQEVNYDSNQHLTFEQLANNKKNFGFKMPNNEPFTITYPNGDPAVFSATNLVLNNRPEKDTVATISNTISSILLEKYASLYPQNVDLQKLVNIPVSTTVTVKAINPNIKSIQLGDKTYTVQEEDTGYTLLTDTTLDTIKVTVDLANKGAKLLISGTDMGHTHNKTIHLTHGFDRFVVKASDEDSKQDGTMVEKSYNVAVVSKTYLESNIATLPDNVNKASTSDLQLATNLVEQYDLLSESDKNSIENHDRLERYRSVAGDINEVYRIQVDAVCQHLFEGIKGENTAKSMVFTDMEEIYFAKFTEAGIFWSKNANDSDVQITWVKSSHPDYIDVHDGNDFQSRYVSAFKIRKRPARNGKDTTVTFNAKVKHLKNAEVIQNTTVDFTLKAYNAKLDGLSIDQIPTFQLNGKTDYELICNSEQNKATLHINAVIPNVTISVNGKELGDTHTVEINLNTLPKTVKIKVNDMIKVSLNEKWDEKVYNITFTRTQSGAVDKSQLQSKYDEAIAIDLAGYEQGGVNAVKQAITEAKNVLEDSTVLQSAVNTALDNLNMAIHRLVELPNADKDELIEELVKTLHLQKTAYTPESFEVVEHAMEAALELVVDPYVQPSKVTKAMNDLQLAWGDLQSAETVNLTIENDGLTVSNEKAYAVSLNDDLAKLLVNLNAKGTLRLSGSKFPATTATYSDMSLSIPAIASNGVMYLPVAMNQMQLGIAKNKLILEEWDQDIEFKVFAGYNFSADDVTSTQATMTLNDMAGKSVLWIGENNTTQVLKTENVANKGLKVTLPDLTGAIVVYAKNQKDSGPNTPTEPTTKKVTISIDKKTINEGYILKPTNVKLYKNDTVWSVLRRVAKKNKIKLCYRSDSFQGGTYIAAIDGVGEFDHGQGSGWMYCVDRTYPKYTCDEFELEGGETIRLRYTTNLGEDLGDSAPTSVGGSSSFNTGKTQYDKPVVDKSGNVTSSITTETKTKNGNAKVAILGEVVNEAIEDVLKAAKEIKNKEVRKEIKIQIKAEKDAKKVETTIPKNTIQKLKEKMDSVKLTTPLAELTLDKKVLETIAKQADRDVKITAEKVDISKSDQISEEIKQLIGGKPVVEFSITSGRETISQFDGKIIVTLPYTPEKDEDTRKLTVYHINDEGKTEEMLGAHYHAKNKCMVFETNHFSSFAVVYDENKAAFEDVKQGDWCYDAVNFAVTNHLFNGTTETTFSPNINMTRAMFFTVLHRMSGDTTYTGGANWYSPGMEWAKANGVSDGSNPNGQITREQLIAMLWRYQNPPKCLDDQGLSSYSDIQDVSSWALEAMQWAHETGLMRGRTETVLAPKGNATRAEVATMMMRFMEPVDSNHK